MSQAAHKSFYELAYNNTDTQPLSVSYGQSGSNPGKTRLDMNTVGSEEDDHASQNPISQANKDDDPMEVVTDDEDNEFALPRKSFHQFPHTPNLAGRKRKASKEILSENPSSTKRAPASLLKTLNARDSNNISLTQAFGNTQADTSPFGIGGVKSDPVFDRPSPEFIVRFTSPTSPLFNNIMLNGIAEGNENTSPGQDPHGERDDLVATQVNEESTIHKSFTPSRTKRVPHKMERNDLEGAELSKYPPDVTRTAIKSSPDAIQVPRSSRNFKSDAGNGHHSSLIEDIDRIEGTPIESPGHNGKTNALPPTQVSDRITDSQCNTQKDNNINALSSPLLRAKSSHPKLIYNELALEKNHLELLGVETQDALAASSPMRPPRGSSPTSHGSDKQNEDGSQRFHNSAASRADHIKKVPKRLSDIAAESSNPRLDMSLDFDTDDRTEAEKAYDEQFPESAPISPKIRKRTRAMPRYSPFKRSLRQSLSNDGLINMASSTPTTEQHSHNVLDSGIPLSNLPGLRESATGNSNGGLARPKRFLGEMNRRKQVKANRKMASTANSNIFDVEESQFQAPAIIEERISPEADKQPLDVGTATKDNMVVDVSALPIRYPDRIFVYWPGPYDACFPATCLQMTQTTDESTTLDIIDDGGTREQIHVGKMVFKLQLRPGDIIKIELPSLNRKRYVVVGFKDPYIVSNQAQAGKEASDEPSPKTDVYGHQTVVLASRGRDSIPGSTDFSNTIEVPISNIKLCRSEFVNFENRKYIPTASLGTLLKAQLPRSNPSTSPSLTNIPTSATSEVDKASQIFSNMCFAISLRSDEEEKKKTRLTTAINRNGGHILERDLGFEELFVTASFPIDSNTKLSSAESLILSEEFKYLGFTALVADEYSRTPKYMQALSLNIPILHYRWIHDCIAKGKTLSWAAYVLPAGESAFLFGAIRSRVLVPYDPHGEYALLKEVLTRRHKIFQNKSILSMRSRNTSTERKRKTCMFLLAALGANEIGLVSDVSEAKRKLRSEAWDFVYANDDEKSTRHTLGTGTWQVLANETVVQSLILGNLYTPNR
jgi:BRCA1 C Terminus (BRCT) domain/Fungal Rad9-like Rad53-binding